MAGHVAKKKADDKPIEYANNEILDMLYHTRTYSLLLHVSSLAATFLAAYRSMQKSHAASLQNIVEV
jgi:hypothetical protein